MKRRLLVSFSWSSNSACNVLRKLQLDYIAFGAHGPREPLTKPGHSMKVFGGVVGVLAASGALFYAIRVNGKYTLSIL